METADDKIFRLVDQILPPTTSFAGMRVETCPISGTIERGSDPLEDAEQVKKLLSNKKEESELTMCTDVDRNDKSRICKPGTVKILGDCIVLCTRPPYLSS